MFLELLLWLALFAALAFTAVNALAKETTAAIIGLFATVILCLVLGGGA